MIKDSAPPLAPTSTEGVMGGVPGGIPGGVLGGVLGGIIRSTPAVQRVRVSQGLTEGLLINKVKPEYPPLARQARILGMVVLNAVISRDGGIQNLRVISGHPLLALLQSKRRKSGAIGRISSMVNQSRSRLPLP